MFDPDPDQQKTNKAVATLLFTLMFLGGGGWTIYESVMDLIHGIPYVFSGRGIHGHVAMTPWFPLILGCVFFGVGLWAAWKICQAINKL
jgi:hypothetical protein